MISFLRFVVLAIGIGMIYSSLKYMLKYKKADFTMFFSGLFCFWPSFFKQQNLNIRDKLIILPF